MRTFFSIIILIILAFFQISFLPYFEIFNAIPNLILVIALAWCIAGNFKEALVWGICGGIILDLFSPFYFGVITLSILATIAATYFITQNFINNDDKVSLAAICAISTILYNLVLAFLILIAKLVKLDDLTFLFSWQFFLSIFVQIILNTIIISLIYNFIKSVQSLQNYYEQRRQIKT